MTEPMGFVPAATEGGKKDAATALERGDYPLA
jgi:hypothetical protein